MSSMEHGAWRKEHGERSMEHGERSMEHGERSMEKGVLSLGVCPAFALQAQRDGAPTKEGLHLMI